MSVSDDILALRDLVLARGAVGNANQPTRAGSILFAHRPAYRLVNDAIAAVEPDAMGLEAQMALLRQRTMEIAPSVGRIEVQIADGSWKPVGTCFRVPGGPSRVVTSGHMLQWMLDANGKVRQGYRYQFRGGHRTTRAVFGPATYKMATIIWAHAKWDLLVFDLEDAASAVPPVALEAAAAWGTPTENPVAVIGFPMSDDPLAAPNELEAIFGGRRMEKCAAPGLAVCAQQLPDLPVNFSPLEHWLGHDASTLPGNSGSPVVSLVTGRVVGVHGDPGRRGASLKLNGAVDLPLAFTEQALKTVIAGPLGASVGQPRRWSVRAPLWEGQGEMATPPARESAALSAILPDRSDFRDLIYRPALVRPTDQVIPRADSQRVVGNQGAEPSCAGFALAVAIERQLVEIGRRWTTVSPRMLYESAREQDEFLDPAGSPGGTSLRAAIKGFYHNGACAEATAPYRPGDRHWSLPIAAAIEARQVTLGAYYRVERRLTDMQSAIVEAGAVVVSARVHGGWFARPPVRRIAHRANHVGNHAFAVIGYDASGFIIQNSWGPEWGNWEGQPGLAHWSYEDWAANVIDAWVLRLAPLAPGSLNLPSRPVNEVPRPAPAGQGSIRPRRSSVLGHVAQTEVRGIVSSGKLGPGLASLRETALFLGSAVQSNPRKPRNGTKYRDIAVFLHDPLLPPDAPSNIARALIEDFKARKIYPFHIFHGLDAAQTLMARMTHEAQTATRRFSLLPAELELWLDQRARDCCGDLVGGLAAGARVAARPGGAVHDVLSALMSEIDVGEDPRRVHLIGTGLGAVTAQELASLDPRDLPRGIVGLASLTMLDALLPKGAAAPAVAAVHFVTQGRTAARPMPDGYAGNWPRIARAAAGATAEPPAMKAQVLGEASLPEAVMQPTFARAVLAAITDAREQLSQRPGRSTPAKGRQ